MFNFVKLERRIKFKGFDNILYGTTAVQLAENWNYLLLVRFGMGSLAGIPIGMGSFTIGVMIRITGS